MRRDGVAEDLGEAWTLGPADMALIAGLPASGRLGLVAQLAHWRAHGRFPDDEADCRRQLHWASPCKGSARARTARCAPFGRRRARRRAR